MFKYLQLETTTFCNATCWFCPNSSVAKEHMDIDLIKKIIDNTRGLGITYRPFGLGDPLVDTRMTEICSYIKQDETAIVEIHSNGEPMTKRLELNIAPHVDIVRFSVDGITKKTFDETRGVSFNRTYDNVKRFIENNPDIDIEVRMIDLPDTADEQQDFLKYWNSIREGCANITTLYSHPWEGQTSSITTQCLKVVDEVFVYVNGDVMLCPWDFAKRNIIGNTNTDHIINIWNSPIYQEYRDILAKGNRCDIEVCSRCDARF